MVASGIIRLKMFENHWINSENGNIKIKLPPIRRQSHLCIKIALRTEVNIPSTMNAQKRVVGLFPRTAIPRLFSAAVQYAEPRNWGWMCELVTSVRTFPIELITIEKAKKAQLAAKEIVRCCTCPCVGISSFLIMLLWSVNLQSWKHSRLLRKINLQPSERVVNSGIVTY